MKPLNFNWILICVTLLLCTVSLKAAEKLETEKKQQAETERLRLDVKSVLRAEQKGTLKDRERVLAPLLDGENVPDEAYWQAGYLKQGERWISVKDRPLSVHQEALRKEYAAVRARYDHSEQSHWELARWCHEHELDEQCRAHLMAILLDHPDHLGLRQMLGYQKIGNRWMNAEDYQAAVREADRLAKELTEWGPKVASIRDDLTNPVLLKRNGAKARLKDILDVAAVPALEMILLTHSDEAAALCVQQLSEIDHRRASIALCKAAMFLPDSAATTKQAAIEELKTRPYEDFVPVLLMELSTPYTHQMSCITTYSSTSFSSSLLRGNWLFPDQFSYRVVSQNEQAYTKNISIKTEVFEPRVQVHRMPRDTLFERNAYGIAKRDQILGNALEQNWRKLLNSVRTTEHQLESMNRNIHNRNELITETLSEITNSSNSSEPDQWWDWWNDRIEVDGTQKQTRTTNVVETDNFSTPRFLYPASCFVAGTPVWTDRGAIPIEQLRVGDMALSKNIETGEVAYQPIIRTTTREPKPLVIINLGVEQITSTGGHPVWVAGEGWVRARELQAGQLLHTPTGAVPIESVTETKDDKTYNLIVDGSHTYFVGQSQVLVHDVSITSPTDAVVPGLIER